MMKKIIFLLNCLFIVYPLLSQTNTIFEPEVLIRKADSLLSTDVNRAIILAKSARSNYKVKAEDYVKTSIILGIAYKNSGNYDSSLYFVKSGLVKAKEIHDTTSIIKLYSNRGVVEYLRANYSTAANDFSMAKQYYEAIRNKIVTDTVTYLEYAKVMNNMASVYIKTGQSDSALAYFIKSFKIRQEYKAPKRMLIVSKLNIGSIYLATGDNENARSWLNKALVCSSDVKDSNLMAKCYLNLGIIDKNTGDTSSAIQNYKAGLLLSKNTGNKRNQAIALQNLALLLNNQEKYDEAYTYFIRALEINSVIHANNSRLQLAMSRMFMHQHLYDSAIVHSSRSLKFAKESGNINVQLEVYDLLSKAYKGKRQFHSAHTYIEKYLFLKDSITTQENQDYVENLKTEFETERKENEIVFLKELNKSEHIKVAALQSRQRLIIIVVLLALALITLVGLYYLSKRKKEKELFQVEKKLLKTELDNKELASRELQLEIIFKTKQLTTHALNMVQKNQILSDVREKIKKLSKRVDGDLVVDFMSVVRDINHIQKTEKDWELFKKYFESINSSFNKKLNKINPNLSVNDYRLAALISLNMNIKEASTVLNISPGSVKLARHRLRKKLGLSTGDDLYVFLNQL